MAMITLVSGKGAPGTTTTAAALAAAWPVPVLLADCDPAGGDLGSGWLGHWQLAGRIRADRGVLAYATASRHDTTGDPRLLLAQLQVAPPAPHVGFLTGLASPSQHASIDAAGWTRVTAALAAVRTPIGRPADSLVDVGRYGPVTPWPLLLGADLVLLAVRPQQRHLLAARPVLTELAERIPTERLGLAVCATNPTGTREVQAVLGSRAMVQIGFAARAATVFSDGTDAGTAAPQSPICRDVRHAARRLHHTYHHYTPHEQRRFAPVEALADAFAARGGTR